MSWGEFDKTTIAKRRSAARNGTPLAALPCVPATPLQQDGKTAAIKLASKTPWNSRASRTAASQHRAIEDARNMARLFQAIARPMEPLEPQRLKVMEANGPSQQLVSSTSWSTLHAFLTQSCVPRWSCAKKNGLAGLILFAICSCLCLLSSGRDLAPMLTRGMRSHGSSCSFRPSTLSPNPGLRTLLRCALTSSMSCDRTSGFWRESPSSAFSSAVSPASYFYGVHLCCS